MSVNLGQFWSFFRTISGHTARNKLFCGKIILKKLSLLLKIARAFKKHVKLVKVDEKFGKS
jgi:hypothetical protein